MKNIIIGFLVVVVAILGYSLVATNNNSQTDTQVPSLSEADPGQTIVGSSAKSLANSGLETVPSSLFDDTSIKELDLSGNRLTGALPAEIRKLSNLEVLDASDNNLTGIPAEIGQLPKLRILSFANNDISGLPLELGNLRNLEIFDLRDNPNLSTYDLNLIKPKLPNTQILTD